MKKILTKKLTLLILTLFLIMPFLHSSQPVPGQALQTAITTTTATTTTTTIATATTNSTTTYTRYGKLNENAILLDNDFNPVTSLPPTFFVIITNEEEFPHHYRVTYLDLVGIIARSHITRIDFQPVTLFHANTNFTAQNDTHPVNIRQSPHSNSGIIATIPHGSSAFLFGQMQGEALIPTHGTRWYFVRFLDGAVQRFGYVYSAQGVADSMPANIIERVPDESNGNQSNGNGYQSPPVRLDWLYIVLLSIPAIIVVFALFSKPKKDKDEDRGFS